MEVTESYGVSEVSAELGLGPSIFFSMIEHAERIIQSSYYPGETWPE